MWRILDIQETGLCFCSLAFQLTHFPFVYLLVKCKFVKFEYSGIVADNTLHRLSHRLLAVLDVLFEPISYGFSAALALHAD